jgi:hypothetical protein
MASHGGLGTQRDRTELVTTSPSGVHVSKPGDPRDAGETQLLWKDDLEVLEIVVAKNQFETRYVQTERVWLCAWLLGGSLSLLTYAHLAKTSNGYAQGSSSEYQMKAAYLLNFLKFVEWPEDAFADPLAPVVIGVVGNNPFGFALQQITLGKTVQGRNVIVRRYRVGEDLRGSHILFISASEQKRLPEILSSLRGASVLTVADMDRFLEAGGMIQFSLEETRVRFTINPNATNQTKLKLSSKLLSVARVAKVN